MLLLLDAWRAMVGRRKLGAEWKFRGLPSLPVKGVLREFSLLILRLAMMRYLNLLS